MSHKSEVKNLIQKFYRLVQRKFNVNIKKFMSNNAKDFLILRCPTSFLKKEYSMKHHVYTHLNIKD